MDRESIGSHEVPTFELVDEEHARGEAAVEIVKLEERLAVEQNDKVKEELMTQIEALRNSLQETIH